MRGTAAISLAVVGFIACGTQIPTSVDVVDGVDASGPPDGGTTTDASISVPLDAADAPAPLPTGGNGTVDPCAESYKPGPNDIFVTEQGSDDADCGATAKPCTLMRALGTKAQTINIANGTYAMQVKLTNASIRIFGGWTVAPSGWTRSCTPGKVILSSSLAVGVFIDNSAVTLSYLDIMTKATAVSGESLYGLYATNVSRITLDHVNIVAAAGGDGADGGPGAAAISYDCSNQMPYGTAGSPGSTGRDGSLAFTSAGIVSNLGGVGGIGTAGHAGKPATVPIATLIDGVNCGAGTAPTDPQSCLAKPCTHTAKGNQGAAGCGGLGGSGGNPGTNGGSSIGLYVTTRSTVSVVSGSIKSGNGGSGGHGGFGGNGIAGQPGVEGAPNSDPQCLYDAVFDCNSLPYSACDPTPTTQLYLAYGTRGGDGGPGGAGGSGGNGEGGFSYGWARDTSSNIELATTAPVPTISYGSPGTGLASASGESKIFPE